MIKKIVMWSIFAGVVGLLIFGAVIRTQAKTTDNTQPRAKSEEHELENLELAGEGFGNFGESSRRESAEPRNEDEVHLADEQDHEWITKTGSVVDLNSQSLWIETGEGDILEITRRAWRFIQESGLELSIGDEIKLEGFYENDEFGISNLENLTSGESLQIREDSGRPLWGGGSY